MNVVMMDCLLVYGDEIMMMMIIIIIMTMVECSKLFMRHNFDWGSNQYVLAPGLYEYLTGPKKAITRQYAPYSNIKAYSCISISVGYWV